MIAITTRSSISVNPLRAGIRRRSIIEAIAFMWMDENRLMRIAGNAPPGDRPSPQARDVPQVLNL